MVLVSQRIEGTVVTGQLCFIRHQQKESHLIRKFRIKDYFYFSVKWSARYCQDKSAAEHSLWDFIGSAQLDNWNKGFTEFNTRGINGVNTRGFGGVNTKGCSGVNTRGFSGVSSITCNISVNAMGKSFLVDLTETAYICN